MRIRIWILVPHWKKMDPDPGNFFKIYWIFFFDTKFQILVSFIAYFVQKLDEPFRKEETLIISLSKVQIWCLGVKKIFFCKFWLIFYPLGPDPWIRIFCESGSGSRKPKSWGSNGSGSRTQFFWLWPGFQYQESSSGSWIRTEKNLKKEKTFFPQNLKINFFSQENFFFLVFASFGILLYLINITKPKGKDLFSLINSQI